MSPKPKPQSTEVDHIRNTLTDETNLLGQTRAEMHQRFDKIDERFDQQDHRAAEQEVHPFHWINSSSI